MIILPQNRWEQTRFWPRIRAAGQAVACGSAEWRTLALPGIAR